MGLSGNGGKGEFGGGGRNAYLVLTVCSLLFMINYMDRQVLSAVLEPMRQDLGLTDRQAGGIQTVFFMSMAVFAFPASFLVDRWSRRKAISLMAIIWSAFTFITGLGRSFLGVALPRTMVAVGETGFSAGGIAWISASFPVNVRGRAMGIFYIAIPLGTALGVILGGYVSANFGGWRVPFYWFAAPGIVLGILALFLRDYKTVQETDQEGRRLGFFSSAVFLFRVPTLRWLYIGAAMANIMNYSLLTWLPAYLMRAHGWGEDKAGLHVGIIGMMALMGAPLGGFLADMWYKRNPRGRLYLPAAASLVAACVLVPALWFKVVGPGFPLALVWGVLAVLVMPPLVSASQDVVAPGLKGTSIGMFNLCTYVLGGGWAPWVVGLVSDGMGGGAEGLQLALTICAGGGVVGAALFYWASRHVVQDMAKVEEISLQDE